MREKMLNLLLTESPTNIDIVRQLLQGVASFKKRKELAEWLTVEFLSKQRAKSKWSPPLGVTGLPMTLLGIETFFSAYFGYTSSEGCRHMSDIYWLFTDTEEEMIGRTNEMITLLVNFLLDPRKKGY